jgi:hypothetical protein
MSTHWVRSAGRYRAYPGNWFPFDPGSSADQSTDVLTCLQSRLRTHEEPSLPL